MLVALVASCSGCTTSLSHLKCCWCFSFGEVRINVCLMSGKTVSRFTQPSTVVQNKLSIVNRRTETSNGWTRSICWRPRRLLTVTWRLDATSWNSPFRNNSAPSQSSAATGRPLMIKFFCATPFLFKIDVYCRQQILCHMILECRYCGSHRYGSWLTHCGTVVRTHHGRSCGRRRSWSYRNCCLTQKQRWKLWQRSITINFTINFNSLGM